MDFLDVFQLNKVPGMYNVPYTYLSMYIRSHRDPDLVLDRYIRRVLRVPKDNMCTYTTFRYYVMNKLAIRELYKEYFRHTGRPPRPSRLFGKLLHRTMKWYLRAGAYPWFLPSAYLPAATRVHVRCRACKGELGPGLRTDRQGSVVCRRCYSRHRLRFWWYRSFKELEAFVGRSVDTTPND